MIVGKLGSFGLNREFGAVGGLRVGAFVCC